MSRVASPAATGTTVLLLTPVFAWGLTGVAHAYELQLSPSGDPVRWFEDDVVFRIELDDRAAGLPSGAAADAAQRALATWSRVGGPLLAGVTGGTQVQSGPVIRLVTDPDDPDLDPGSLARTRLTYDPSSARVTNVSIAVNAIDYRWSAGEPCAEAYDLEATLAHELGHALGLRHSRDPEATMFTSPRPCEHARRDLAADDLDGLAVLYGGTIGALAVEEPDSMTGCAASDPSAGPPAELAFAALAGVLGLVRRRGRRERDQPSGRQT